MLITNELSPTELIFEFLKFSRASSIDTADFRDLKHDNDLCPGFQRSLQFVLDVYKSYATDVHDIQGMRDEGVDVLIKFRNAGTENKIGIQIKSYAEIELWKTKGVSLINTLKAQYATAVNTLKVDQFIILICTDSLAHKRYIRTICSELKTFQDCRIIEPHHALTLFRMSQSDIFVETLRLLCRSDPTLRAARDELDQYNQETAYVLTLIVCHAFLKGPSINDMELRLFIDEWDNLPKENEQVDAHSGISIDELFESNILTGISETYNIDITEFPPALCSLFFDQRFRQLIPDHLIGDHLLRLLGIIQEADDDDKGEQ
jgi:hypothetical protein